jgi:hypothetical protein
MQIAPFSRSEQLLIEACANAGVVFEFVLVDCGSDAADAEWTHRRAVVLAVNAACATMASEIARNFERLIREDPDHEDQHRKTASEAIGHWTRAGRAEVDPAALHGYRLGLRDLYGDAFDPSQGVLDDRKTKYAGDEFDRAWTLVDAFVSTPYSLRVRGEELQQLWTKVVVELLQSPQDSTTMFRWDGDWSPFFDAGREWWGAAAWTITRSPSQLLVVCASTTD